MKILLVFLVVMLGACAMSPEEIALENQKLAIMKAVAEKPTLKCEQGCEYTDPKRNLAALFPTETNGWDFANNVVNAVTTVAPWAAVTKVAIDGMAAAGTVYNNSQNTTSGDVVTSGDVATRGDEITSGDVITSGDTENISGIKAGGDIDQSQQNENNPTTTTTTTETITDDNSVTTDDNSTTTVPDDAP